MPSAPRTQTSFILSCHQRYSPTIAFFFSLAFLGFISLDRTSLAHGARLISSQETGIPSKSQQNAYTTAPCVSGKEVYFGNSSQILCLDIQTGAHRVYKDLLTSNMSLPSLTAQLSAVGGQLFYTGWGAKDPNFSQTVVDVDTKTGKVYATKVLRTLPQQQSQIPQQYQHWITNWNELIFDPIQRRFWCSYDDVKGVRHLYYFNGPTAEPTYYASFPLPCSDDCGTSAFSPQSVLDSENAMYYSLIVDKGSQTVFIVSIDLKKKEMTATEPTKQLYGLKTISLNPTNKKIYGWLSLQKRVSSARSLLHNTTIVEIDPSQIGAFSVKVLIDLPEDKQVSSRDSDVPYLTTFDWPNGRVTTLMPKFDTASKLPYQALKTFDLQSGRLLHDVRVESFQTMFPWGLAYPQ